MSTVEVDPAFDHCVSCPADVFWAETVTGKAMLVDADPVVGGNLRRRNRPGKAPMMEVVAKHLAFGTALYVSHFVTCAAAKQHRRKRGGA